MSGRAFVGPGFDKRWRKPAVIGVSVLVHALVLGGMAFSVIELKTPLTPPTPPVILVEIEPRPLLQNEQPRPRPAPTAASEAAAPASEAQPQRSILGFRLPFTRDRDEEKDEDRPAPPTPRLAAPAPGVPAPPAAADPWQVRPETMGDRVGRGLRTRGPGCASPQLLSREERAVCDERFGERAAAAAPIEGTGDPDRDAAFAREGRRALAEYEARRRPLSGGTGIVPLQDGPGSNFGMGVAGAHLDPSFRPDSTENIRTNQRDGPR